MSAWSPAEIAAYIGAMAWIPQIVSWVYKRFVIPAVRIIPEKQVEIGYTVYGPIVNLRLALSTETKDVIIDNLELTLTHEAGETHTLRWDALQESQGDIRDETGL